jgi:hypothetical protein
MLLTFIANLRYAAGTPPYFSNSESIGGKGNEIYQDQKNKQKRINMEDSETIMIVKFTLKNFIV